MNQVVSKGRIIGKIGATGNGGREGCLKDERGELSCWRSDYFTKNTMAAREKTVVDGPMRRPATAKRKT